MLLPVSLAHSFWPLHMYSFVGLYYQVFIDSVAAGYSVAAPLFSCSVVSDSLRPHGLQPSRLLCPWDFPGTNTRMGCHLLHQGIFPTQGSNPHLLHWQADSVPLSHLGSSCIVSSCERLQIKLPKQLHTGLHMDTHFSFSWVNA